MLLVLFIEAEQVTDTAYQLAAKAKRIYLVDNWYTCSIHHTRRYSDRSEMLTFSCHLTSVLERRTTKFLFM